MRSRKKNRQTATSGAGPREQSDEGVSERAQQADAFAEPDVTAGVGAPEIDPVVEAAVERVDDVGAPGASDASDASAVSTAEVAAVDEVAEVDAEPIAEVPTGPTQADIEAALDPKDLLVYLRQRVLDLPSDVGARTRLGELHERRLEPLLALEQFQAAAAVDPDNAQATLRFAQALTNLNRFAEAERELRRVLKLEPDNGPLHLQLGTISFRRGLYSQAEIELKRALELLPDAASAYFHRGESLNQLSRIDEALEMLERGIALDPNYSRAYYIMGILYDRKSRPQEAGAMYKKARELTRT
ncbi:MAG: tetratricopeptide repeat protein [Longimicrobiales bacterium]